MTKTYLKIKIMSLAAEARIIRCEEKKWPGGDTRQGYTGIREGLHLHRIHEVRPEARAALVAYGFLRGRTYRAIEAKAIEPPNWPRVLTLINKYGPTAKMTKDELAAWSEPEKVAA